jgi:P27 family predicted phage terminase small subunit
VPAPAFLDTRARAEWARLAPQLETLGVLTAVDRSALELYCDTYARWRELRCDLARWRRDRVKRDQAWRLEAALDRVAALLRQLMAEFGLTPAARTRIEADEPLPPAQPTKTGTETSKAAVARFFRD